MDTAGTELTRLTGPGSPNPDLAYTIAPQWSPDGERLLFTVVAGIPRGIYSMNADGSDARLLVEYGVGAGWYPDGKRIVYANWDTTEVQGRRRQLYVAKADGSEQRKLTDLPNSDYLGAPEVSPDGSQITFLHQGVPGASVEVYVMNVDGTEIRQLTQGPSTTFNPRWHPDGRRVLFTRFVPNVSEGLYWVDVETLEVEPVFPARSD